MSKSVEIAYFSVVVVRVDKALETSAVKAQQSIPSVLWQCHPVWDFMLSSKSAVLLNVDMFRQREDPRTELPLEGNS